METTDLVELEELKRRLLEPISARVSAPTNPDGPDAVAAITALQARVEKLEQIVRDLRRFVTEGGAINPREVVEQIDAALAEGERGRCPRAIPPLRYCRDCDGSFPCQLPGRKAECRPTPGGPHE